MCVCETLIGVLSHSGKGQLIGVFNFLQKTNAKQVDLRFHSSKVEFLRLFFRGNVGLKKSFRLCLTFSKFRVLTLKIYSLSVQ